MFICICVCIVIESPRKNLNTFILTHSKIGKVCGGECNGLKYLPVHFDVWLDQRFLDMGDLFASED